MKRISPASTSASKLDRQLHAPQLHHQRVIDALQWLKLPLAHLERIRKCHGLLDSLARVEIDLPRGRALIPLPALLVGAYARCIADAGLPCTAAWLLALHLTADVPDLRTCSPCQKQCADLLSGLDPVVNNEPHLYALLKRHVNLMDVLKLGDGSGIQLLIAALGKFTPLSLGSVVSPVLDRVDEQLAGIVGAAVQTLRMHCERNNAFTTFNQTLRPFIEARDAIKNGLAWGATVFPPMPQGELYRLLLKIHALTDAPLGDTDRDQFWEECEATARLMFHHTAETMHERIGKAGFAIDLNPPNDSASGATGWHCELRALPDGSAKDEAALNLFVQYIHLRIKEGELLRAGQVIAYADCIKRNYPPDAGREQQFRLCLFALMNDPSLIEDKEFEKLITPGTPEETARVKQALTECFQRLRSVIMSKNLTARHQQLVTILPRLLDPSRHPRPDAPLSFLSFPLEAELWSRAGIRLVRRGSAHEVAFDRNGELPPSEFDTLMGYLRRRRASLEAVQLLEGKLHSRDKTLAEQRQSLLHFANLIGEPSMVYGPSLIMLTLARFHLYGLPLGTDSRSMESITRPKTTAIAFDRDNEVALICRLLPGFVGNLIKEMPDALADHRAMHYLFSLAQDIGHPEFLHPLRAALEQDKDKPPIARILRAIQQLEQAARISTEVAQALPREVGMDIV